METKKINVGCFGMVYWVKAYKTHHAYLTYQYDMPFGVDSFGTFDDACVAAKKLVDDGEYQVAVAVSDDPSGVMEVFKESPIELKRDRLKCDTDGYVLDIYIDNGEDKDPTQICYWNDDEWKEDPESVVPAMLNAMYWFYNNPQELLDKLNMHYLLVD